MYTQCPQCLTIYEIDEDALQASFGIVHCGRCDARFDALRTLSDSLPEAPLTPLPERELAAPTLTEAVPPAAYEAAARKRRSLRTTAGDNQHELALPPAVGATTRLDDADARPAADDWFADLESELTGEAPGSANAADPAIPIDAGSTADVSAPPEAMSLQADATDPAFIAKPADNGAALAETATPFPAAVAPGPVVSPRLLDGDVSGADSEGPLVTEPEMADAATSSVEALEAASPAPIDEPPAATGKARETSAEESDSDDRNQTADTAPTLPTPAPDAFATAPIYVRPRQRLLSTNGLLWFAGCLLLALLLAAQLAWIDRVDLVRNPATRDLAQSVCAHFPCRLPPIKDVAQLELLSRDVRPDPNAQGALTITATLRNNAGFRQPWPIVTVELTDFDNHAVAMRRFRPAEYMPDAVRRAAGIAPGATAAVAFEVADPGKRAGGYRFGFE